LENSSSQFCEASTSLPFENNKKKDFYPYLNDFLLNMHIHLLKQEIEKQIVIAKVSIYVFVIVYYNEFSGKSKAIVIPLPLVIIF